MDECQNVIAFDDFDAIDAIDDETTENTTTNMVNSTLHDFFFTICKKKKCFSCLLPFCLFAILIT